LIVSAAEGCRRPTEVASNGAAVSQGASIDATGSAPGSQPAQAPELRILFIGNSHTAGVPELAQEMIHHLCPHKRVRVEFAWATFLEEVAAAPKFGRTLKSQTWDFVILQGQKISMSGRYDYSKREAIEFAKQAKAGGAMVYYFSEWGRRGVTGDGAAIQKIYQAMADEAGVDVAAVGMAWDLALAANPDLPLYAADGNHQSPVGAFLTGSVLTGLISGMDVAPLANFQFQKVDGATRSALIAAAAKSLALRAIPIAQ
jgi:hypothetical protein